MTSTGYSPQSGVFQRHVKERSAHCGTWGWLALVNGAYIGPDASTAVNDYISSGSGSSITTTGTATGTGATASSTRAYAGGSSG